MKILIVSATDFEIAPFFAQNKMSDILVTGVGAPACMYSLTKKLHTTKYNYVIQAGIAGSFNNSFLLGETCVVHKDTFADLGISESDNFSTLFEAGFNDANKAPYIEGWLINEKIKNYNLKPAIGITVNTVTDDLKKTSLYQKKFNADVESMEGAAFHFTCINEGINFVQIRGISNAVGDRVKANWKIREAVESLNINLSKILETLEF